MIEVICGDVRDLPVRGPFHAILCDPPYELGFMGKSWDAQGVAYDAEMWRRLVEMLHPGGFGMAFGGSRTYHRLAFAIEDAGAVLHPMIGWVYGNGFPKATRIDTQVDRAAGAEQMVVGKSNRHGGGKNYNNVTDSMPGATPLWRLNPRIPDITAPSTPLARTWASHRYGLQALKPALEPICVFQRPYVGKPWECITATGAGAMWIDGAKVPANGESPTALRRSYGYTPNLEKAKESEARGALRDRTDPAKKAEPHPADNLGRWPANLILGHAPSCNGTCADGCAVKALGEQSGERPSGGAMGTDQRTKATPGTMAVVGFAKRG